MATRISSVSGSIAPPATTETAGSTKIAAVNKDGSDRVVSTPTLVESQIALRLRVAVKLIGNVLGQFIRESSLLAPDFRSFRRQEFTFIVLNLILLTSLFLTQTLLLFSYFGQPASLAVWSPGPRNRGKCDRVDMDKQQDGVESPGHRRPDLGCDRIQHVRCLCVGVLLIQAGHPILCADDRADFPGCVQTFTRRNCSDGGCRRQPYLFLGLGIHFPASILRRTSTST